MNSIQGPVYAKRKSPGRTAVPVGLVLIILSVALGIITSVVTVPKISDSLSRDVIISGSPNPKVPGRLSFRVVSPMSGDPDLPMTVGIAVTSTQLPEPTCRVETEGGDDVQMLSPRADATVLRADSERYHVVAIADLRPGSYVAVCERDASATESATFTVGHAFDSSNLDEFIPLFWLLGLLALAALLFLVGAVTLVVGIIRRGRARRDSTNTGVGGPYGGYGPPGAASGYPGPGVPPPGSYGGPSAPGVGVPAPGGPLAPGQGFPPQPAPPSGLPTGMPPGSTPPSPPAYGNPPSGSGQGDDGLPWSQPSPGQSQPGTGEQPPPSGWTIPPSKR